MKRMEGIEEGMEEVGEGSWMVVKEEMREISWWHVWDCCEL